MAVMEQLTACITSQSMQNLEIRLNNRIQDSFDCRSVDPLDQQFRSGFLTSVVRQRAPVFRNKKQVNSMNLSGKATRLGVLVVNVVH